MDCQRPIGYITYVLYDTVSSPDDLPYRFIAALQREEHIQWTKHAGLMRRENIPTSDVHRIFSGGEGRFSFSGILALFYLFYPKKLLKFPPNEVKKKKRTGERSEPRNFLEYAQNPIFEHIFPFFSGIDPIFIGEHFLGSHSRGGGANSDHTHTHPWFQHNANIMNDSIRRSQRFWTTLKNVVFGNF